MYRMILPIILNYLYKHQQKLLNLLVIGSETSQINHLLHYAGGFMSRKVAHNVGMNIVEKTRKEWIDGTHTFSINEYAI